MNAKLYLLLFTLITSLRIYSMEPNESALLPSRNRSETIGILSHEFDRLYDDVDGLYDDLNELPSHDVIINIPPKIDPTLALYYADVNNDAALRDLLDQGLDPNTNDSGMSLLHYAVRNDNLLMSEMLLQHPKFDPTYTMRERYEYNDDDTVYYTESPLQLALKYNHLKIAKRVVTAALSVSANQALDIYIKEASDSTIDIFTDIFSLNVDDQKLSRLLFYATNGGQIQLVTMLLKLKGIDINYAERANGATSLCQAALTGNIPVLKLLIEHGAQFRDALSYAINRGNVYSAEFLIDHGAPLNVKEEDKTLLASALLCNKGITCAHMIQLLLDKGADVNEIADNDGNVLLGLIARRASSCHKAIKVILAQPNIDINIKNKAGKTPLDIAIEVRKDREHSLDVPDWDYLIDQIKKHKESKK